ncbi:MAG: ATP-binding protein [Candidatus Muirbacterium halophilum]|nr:ATP-binding protein [Candidatus Muirbacterium halophilum]MCK9476820.1 ATP-binding protein [Candidatus Muirbacterium halophilum]
MITFYSQKNIKLEFNNDYTFNTVNNNTMFDPEFQKTISDINPVFVFDDKNEIYSFKMNSYLNKFPVLYFGIDDFKSGIIPDFYIMCEDEFNLHLNSYWEKRKKVKRELSIILENNIKDVNKLINDVYYFIEDIFERDDGLYVKLAIDEALVNAYKHGNKKEPEKRIFFDLKYYGHKIEITVKDEGEGFNLPEILEKEYDVYSTNGRGLKLIEELMDEVCFKYRGNIINMVKYINQGER